MEFTCPYCNHPTTVTSPNTDDSINTINIVESRYYDGKKRGLRYEAIVCPNTNCKQLTLIVSMQAMMRDSYTNWMDSGDALETWQLLPDSLAKPQPEYIPKVIIEDYNEASKILKLSPKAAASLARRCLQGMIRDFHGIIKPTLNQEINALKEIVSAEVWSAIDAVRSVGNIGAHMEKDVNLIVDIEPDEAELLIELIEDLFDDWYVVRHDRMARQEKLKLLAATKQAARNGIDVDKTPEGSDNVK